MTVGEAAARQVAPYNGPNRIKSEQSPRNLALAFGRWVAKRLPEDWDWWTFGEGPERVGKSNLMIHWCHYVSGPLFKIREHVCYDAEEFLRLVDDCPRYGSILLDEAAEAWFNRDFASSINKALGKASTQIGDRNLNVVLALPSIYLLDTVAIRRCKTLVKVSAPGFVRGKSEWHKPNWQKYAKQLDPYWELKFVHYFHRLPEPQATIYREIKTQKAKERLGGYIDEVRRQKAKSKDQEKDVTADEIIAKVKKVRTKNKELLQNSIGRYDARLLKNKYRSSLKAAEEAAAVLNAALK